MMRPVLAAAIWLVAASLALADAPRLTVWAWERPEDLRFLPPDVDIAVQTGFIVLRGEGLYARPRRFPLLARAQQVTTAVVHLQIDHRQTLNWTPQLRARAAEAVVRLARSVEVRQVQVDFEVRASEHQVLRDVVTDVRTLLPQTTHLTMTALTSWCANETWFEDLPVSEIAPMLFRMGPGGAKIRSDLALGRDFASAKCRTAVAVSADAPITRAPTDRHIYMFSPRSWTQGDFERVVSQITAWSEPVAPPR
jgi:hypothetical protein